MTVSIITPPALARWRDIAKPETRRRIFAVVSDKIENLVRRYILNIAPAHHTAADRLGATHTGHLTKGARTTVSHAGDDFAEVIIPIPGISRAFHNLTITPKNASALTLPISPHSYGQRVSRMRQLGWTIFRPKGEDVLMGERKGKKGKKDQEAVPLYLLRKRVEQPQDRTLLPSDAELSQTAAAAIIGTIDRITKGAA